MKFERDYQKLVEDVLANGEMRVGRNGTVKSVFAKTLEVDMTDLDTFPLIAGRQMYPAGILGEFAAMLRRPKHVYDFERFNCNYWRQWAKEDGTINVDYGNLWFDFDGVNQLDKLRQSLRFNPYDRRMIISGWHPGHLAELDLPCCHMMYQWYVRKGGYLDMIWYQRSVDTMIGLPSDIVLAAIWNVLLANELGYSPGKITMVLGDTHIYEEHFGNAFEYAALDLSKVDHPKYHLNTAKGMPIELFTPTMLNLFDYNTLTKMRFLLKS